MYKITYIIMAPAAATTTATAFADSVKPTAKFFEVLIGKTPEPLWNVLSKVAVLYALEPVFTVIFVINLNTIWEKVMSNVRAQIFQRVLTQKVAAGLLPVHVIEKLKNGDTGSLYVSLIERIRILLKNV